ncbi:MAG: hypothetical protein MJ161_01415 [Clostridia bacterium]|nr:hypothetical protein [Clostridia bacterium]
MKRKNMLSIMLAIVMILSMSLVFGACGSDNEDDQTATAEEQTTEAVDPEAAELQAKAIEMNKDEKNFLGTWVATTANAEYWYGHLEITINEDGTFDADVTDEKFSGTWEKIDGGIRYESELMNGTLFYGKRCRMVIDDQDVKVTLKKVD